MMESSLLLVIIPSYTTRWLFSTKLNHQVALSVSNNATRWSSFLKTKENLKQNLPSCSQGRGRQKIVYSGHLFLEVFSIKVSVS
jgi:hypothetical protein